MRINWKMNKKGFELTAETVIKILIAVICIGFLMYLGYKIYDSINGDAAEKKAVSFVRELESKINAFKSSNLNEMTYLGFPPEGWYMKSFNISKEGHPVNQCVGRFTSCLCVCEEIKCDGKFACRGFKEEIVIDSKFIETVVSPPSGIVSSGSFFTRTYEGIIQFKEVTELNLTKQGSIIKISKNE